MNSVTLLLKCSSYPVSCDSDTLSRFVLLANGHTIQMVKQFTQQDRHSKLPNNLDRKVDSAEDHMDYLHN